MKDVITVVFGEEIDLNNYNVTICGTIDNKYYDDIYFGRLTFKKLSSWQGTWILTTASGEKIDCEHGNIDDALWELSVKVFSHGSKKVDKLLKQKNRKIILKRGCTF